MSDRRPVLIYDKECKPLVRDDRRVIGFRSPLDARQGTKTPRTDK